MSAARSHACDAFRAVPGLRGNMDHTCDACGGTGIDARLEECGCCGCYHYPEFAGDCRSDADRYPSDDCQACDGAGSFSDRMPVRDAIADAETLRRAVPGINGGALVTASLMGRAAIRGLHNRLYNETTFRAVRQSARAAFRAVPGLRGDR